MDFIAGITIALLALMGWFHFYWAFGGKAGLDKALPSKDGKRLFNPGKILTLSVGIILLGVSFVAYLLYFDAAKGEDISYFGWVISALFLMRAIGDFKIVGFFKQLKSTQFAAYDTKYFSPLCLYISICFAILSYQA